MARRRCKVGVNAGCKGSKDQTGHGRKKHWSYYQLKSEKARPHGYLLGIGHRALGIGGEGNVRLPATGMLLLYSVSQEGADKRRQQWMIHEQPDGEGVVGSRSSAAAKIQKMPEWLERRSQIQNQRRVWYQPWPGAGCASSSSRHTSLRPGQKRYRRILFFPPPRRLSAWNFIKKSASHRPLSMRRLSTHPSPPCPTWKNGC